MGLVLGLVLGLGLGLGLVLGLVLELRLRLGLGLGLGSGLGWGLSTTTPAHSYFALVAFCNIAECLDCRSIPYRTVWSRLFGRSSIGVVPLLIVRR